MRKSQIIKDIVCVEQSPYDDKKFDVAVYDIDGDSYVIATTDKSVAENIQSRIVSVMEAMYDMGWNDGMLEKMP